MGSAAATPTTVNSPAGGATGQMGNFALAAQAGAGILGAFGQFQAGSAKSEANLYQAQVAKNNAVLARMQADEVMRRADVNAERALERGMQNQVNTALEYKRMLGSQAAALAANGIVVGRGSALDMERDTRAFAMLDQETALHNAEMEAHAIRTGAMDQVAALNVQTSNYHNQAVLLKSAAGDAKMAGVINAGSTLLTTGSGVAKTQFDFESHGVDTLLS